MTAVHSRTARDDGFTALYIRLASGLGMVSIGGWVALLLDSRGHSIAALIMLVGSAMLAGQRAGASASGFVLLEVTLLVALDMQVPGLVWVWADLGPLTLIAVATIQLPFALAATLIARSRYRKT